MSQYFPTARDVASSLKSSLNRKINQLLTGPDNEFSHSIDISSATAVFRDSPDEGWVVSASERVTAVTISNVTHRTTKQIDRNVIIICTNHSVRVFGCRHPIQAAPQQICQLQFSSSPRPSTLSATDATSPSLTNQSIKILTHSLQAQIDGSQLVPLCAQYLPQPTSPQDTFASQRPLIAVAVSSLPCNHSLVLVSLVSHKIVLVVPLPSIHGYPISIEASSRFVCVCMPCCILVFDPCTLQLIREIACTYTPRVRSTQSQPTGTTNTTATTHISSSPYSSTITSPYSTTTMSSSSTASHQIQQQHQQLQQQSVAIPSSNAINIIQAPPHHHHHPYHHHLSEQSFKASSAPIPIPIPGSSASSASTFHHRANDMHPSHSYNTYGDHSHHSAHAMALSTPNQFTPSSLSSSPDDNMDLLNATVGRDVLVACSCGSRWLACATTDEPHPSSQLPAQPQTEYVEACRTVAKGLAKASEIGFRFVMKEVAAYPSAGVPSPAAAATPIPDPRSQSGGFVKIVDLPTGNTLFHFQAHRSPVTLIRFDPSGSILATASTTGRAVHIFRLIWSPTRPSQSRPQHTTSSTTNSNNTTNNYYSNNSNSNNNASSSDAASKTKTSTKATGMSALSSSLGGIDVTFKNEVGGDVMMGSSNNNSSNNSNNTAAAVATTTTTTEAAAEVLECAPGKALFLFKLVRGATTGELQDICFSRDSRWLAVTSSRGTTHCFLMDPFANYDAQALPISIKVAFRLRDDLSWNITRPLSAPAMAAHFIDDPYIEPSLCPPVATIGRDGRRILYSLDFHVPPPVFSTHASPYQQIQELNFTSAPKVEAVHDLLRNKPAASSPHTQHSADDTDESQDSNDPSRMTEYRQWRAAVETHVLPVPLVLWASPQFWFNGKPCSLYSAESVNQNDNPVFVVETSTGAIADAMKGSLQFGKDHTKQGIEFDDDDILGTAATTTNNNNNNNKGIRCCDLDDNYGDNGDVNDITSSRILHSFRVQDNFIPKD